MKPVTVGIIGSQFQADCHGAAAATIGSEMRVVAVASLPRATHKHLLLASATLASIPAIVNYLLILRP